MELESRISRLLHEIKIELYTSVLLLPLPLFHLCMRWFPSVRLIAIICPFFLVGEMFNSIELSVSSRAWNIPCNDFSRKNSIDSMRHCSRGRFRFVARYIAEPKAFVLRVNGSKGDTTRSTEDDEGCRALSKYPFFFFASILRWPRHTALSSAQRHLVFFGRACTHTRAQTTQRAGRESTRVKTVQFTRRSSWFVHGALSLAFIDNVPRILCLFSRPRDRRWNDTHPVVA